MTIVSTRDELLTYLPKNIKIAELGVFKGEFSHTIYNTINPSMMFLVDTFPEHMCSGNKDGHNVVWANLNHWHESLIKKYENCLNVKIIKTSTTDFLFSLKEDELDAVYIDADHSYEAVKQELNLSYEKVKKGGVIMGHDYTNHMFPGVVQAVNEFCKDKLLEINFLTKDGCPTYFIYNNK
jgi:O-methyltransferase